MTDDEVFVIDAAVETFYLPVQFFDLVFELGDFQAKVGEHALESVALVFQQRGFVFFVFYQF